MSIGPLGGLKNTVLDLLAARPAKPEPPVVEPSGNEPAGRNERRGFGEVLRDREPARPVDEPGKAEGRGVERADKPEASQDGDIAETKSADETGKESEKPKESDKAGEEQNDKQAKQDDAKQAKADEQGEPEQGDEASQAAAQNEQQKAAEMALGQLFGAVKAAQSQEEAESSANSEKQRQAYAAITKAHNEAAAKQSAKDGSVPVFNTVMFSTATTQEASTSSDTGSGEAKGESQASAQVVANSNATTKTSAPATAFNMPAQSAGDGPLPVNSVNPTQAAQQADGAKQAQVLPQINNGDSDSVNTSRLTRGLANAVQQRGGAVTLRLTPPEMGTVRIQMQISGANVSASFHAESASAQTLLTNQLAQLRTSLENQGMSVDRLSVQPLASTSAGQQANQGNNDNQGQQQGQQEGNNDGRSRGQYSGGRNGGGSDDAEQGDTSSRQRARRGFFDRLNDAAETAA